MPMFIDSFAVNADLFIERGGVLAPFLCSARSVAEHRPVAEQVPLSVAHGPAVRAIDRQHVGRLHGAHSMENGDQC